MKAGRDTGERLQKLLANAGLGSRRQLEALQVRGDYRELYLDRSRALYELEVKTDLGDAMTEISALRLDTAFAEFEWMTTQAELAALAGLLPRVAAGTESAA